MGRPTHKAEFREGQEAIAVFNAAMKRILSVPPDEMQRRLAAKLPKKRSKTMPQSVQTAE